MSTSFNELDPTQDPAFPNISDFDPEVSLPPEPDDTEEDPEAPPPEEGLAGVQLDAEADDDLLLEADAPEPEDVTDIEIGGPAVED